MALQHALVVDDSRSARKVLQRMLEKEKLSADSVGSAEEAFEYLKTRRPDVIFMDHMMPGMDGLSATLAIQRNPETSGIPTFMYTSKEGPEYVEEAKSHGALGVLPKPATGTALQKVLDDLRVLDQAKREPAASEEQALPAGAATAPQPPASGQVAELSSSAIESVVEQEVERVLAARTQLLADELRAELRDEFRQTLEDAQKDIKTHIDDVRQLVEAKAESLNVQLEQKTQPNTIIAAIRTTVHKLSVHACQKTVADKLAPLEEKFERQLQQRVQELKIPLGEVETQAQKAEESAKQGTTFAYVGIGLAVVAIVLPFVL